MNPKHEAIMRVTVSPAYSRDYKSRLEAVTAFKEGKDFICEAEDGRPVGKYCSIRDFPIGTQVSIRFQKKRNQALITVRAEEED